MDLGWASALALLLTSALVALGCIFVLAALQRQERRSSGQIFTDTDGGTSFLFDGEVLLDATPNARSLLALGTAGPPWSRMVAVMARFFPDAETQLAGLEEAGAVTIVSADPDRAPLVLSAECRGGLTRIEVSGVGSAGPLADAMTLRALQDELRVLRDAIGQAPILIWRNLADGSIPWANRPYLSAVADRLEPGRDLTWPLPSLFDETSRAETEPGRHRLADPQGRPRWFDVVENPDETGQFNYALPADALVQSEATRRDYTRTLSKTFAHLPIGLAIFDRQNLLVNFNPALVDLCRLPTDLLLSRPTLFAVLDAMRDRNMIPEPKDYRQWQQDLSGAERAANALAREEIWTLPSGETYRLTGRPYPEGGLALMFEDISSETARARRYRAEIELGQAVIDAVDEGIAVFATSGELVMTNRRYADLWGHHPAESVGGIMFETLCAHWQAQSAATRFWDDAARFCRDGGAGSTLAGEIRLRDGRAMACAWSRLPGRMSLARFSIRAQAEPLTEAEPTGERRLRNAP